MKTGTRVLVSVFVVISLLSGLMLTETTSSARDIPKIITFKKGPSLQNDGYIVKLKKSVSLNDFSAENKIKRQSLVKVSLSKARELEKKGKVISKEPNYIRQLSVVPNDSYYYYQYGLRRISAPSAWDNENGTSNSITVAVIDTGVDLNHPELSSKIVQGYDFVNGDSSAQDDHGHGTHVAGIIAASTNNSTGVAGVSWGAKIMPIKVLDSYGMGSDFDVARGIEYAADNGAKVINMSLGGSGYSSSLESATTYAYNRGVTIFAAAGNDGDSSINYPAGNSHVIGVAATDENDKRAWFSNYNSTVDISAPGVDVLSTYYDGRHTYAFMSGTSMATPYAAGAAAVLLSNNPSMTPDELEEDLKVRSNDLGRPGRDNYYGYGRINLNAALNDNLSLTYSSGKGKIRYGQRVRISGSLRPELGSQTIYVKKKRVGSSTWSSASTLATDSSGLFSYSNTPQSSTIYSFRWLGGSGVQGSSDTIRVTVKPRVSIASSRRTVRKGKSVVISGYVYPRHSGKKVNIYFYSSGDRKVRKARLSGSSSRRSKFRLRWRPAKKGRYRLRVRFGDRDHAANNSRLITIRVI